MEDLKRELQANVESWVSNNFNYQRLEVFSKMADESLFEYIRQLEYHLMDFIEDYGYVQELENWLAENDHNKDDRDSYLVLSFIEDTDYQRELEDWKDHTSNENYPMWNTLFEFRNEHGEEVTEKCVEAGFGVIEGMEDFNTTLFVSGAGYSFYAQHWIPLWLSLPYTDNEKYKNIDFSDL
jgi:hypothetical protein